MYKRQLHHDAATGVTRGILLADYLKSVMTLQNLPADVAEQTRDGRFHNQYCPDRPAWLCRPDALPDTDLTLAFERQ